MCQCRVKVDSDEKSMNGRGGGGIAGWYATIYNNYTMKGSDLGTGFRTISYEKIIGVGVLVHSTSQASEMPLGRVVAQAFAGLRACR